MALMEGEMSTMAWKVASPLARCLLARTKLGLGSGCAREGWGPWGADTFAPTELKATGTAHFFNFLLNSSDYRILLKDEDHDRMYVGSKDYILSLDLHDINREPLIVSCHSRAGGRWKGDNQGLFHMPGKSSMGIGGAGGEEVEQGRSSDLPWAGVPADPLARVPAED